MAKSAEVKARIIQYLAGKQPNTRVASRNSMCRQFSASRSTIDKVMKELEDEEIVYSLKGSGTFVSPGGVYVPVIRESRGRRVWAILQKDSEGGIQHEFYTGITEYANSHDCFLVVCDTGEDPERERAYIHWLMKSGIDGAIIVPARSDAYCVSWYRELQKSRIPFVFWQRSYDYMPEIPQVCLNGYRGALIGTRHLIENGYRRIAFLSRYRFRSSMDRFFGYCSALADAGIETDMNIVDTDLFRNNENEAYLSIKAMLEGKNPPDAFLLDSEEAARIVAGLLKEKGLRVPEDVGIVCFESVVRRTQEMEKTTRICLNSFKSGKMVGEILGKLCSGRESGIPKLVVVEPELFVGTTSVREKK